jgi:hypothetical protein
MIKIKKSQSADTRSAKDKVTHDVLLASSHQHIGDVRKAIAWMITRLLEISDKHDFTKIDAIGSFFDDFANVQSNPETDFKTLKWFKLHVGTERHHLNDRCPEDVNLFDVLERIADITMAGMARTGKIYDDTLSPEILTKAYKNTIELLKKNIEVEE